MLDLAIVGGVVVDGTNRARRRADVGVAEGRVVEVGKLSSSARRTIDAEDQTVAPGFIDVHTHYDVQAFWDPWLSPSPLHGITTVIGGNCGFTVAPLDTESSEYLMQTLSRVEGMPLSALKAGAPWDWSSTSEYLDRLEGTLALNAGFMVGHTALRRLVMGESATKRHATSEELVKMTQLLREGLQAGGMGFSTSRGRAHQDANGDPVPSRHAGLSEFEALGSVCGEIPGTSLEFVPHHRPFSDEDRDIALAMVSAARRPLNWNVLSTNATTLEIDKESLTLAGLAAERGERVVGLAMPIDITGRLSFATAFVLDSIPGWAYDMARPLPERLALLRDPTTRERLKLSAQEARGSYGYQDVTDWGQKVIDVVTDPGLKRYEGRFVGDIAAEEGKDPFDALVDIVCADELRTTFSRPAYDSQADWDARAQIWRDPSVIIGGSDAGAHVDFLATFQFSTALLSRAVRDHEIFTLEEAVAALTSRPADLYGLTDRGRLVPGAHADIVIFNDEVVAPGPTTTRWDLPGGAARFYAEAIGVQEVLVNGRTIVAQGEFTDVLPGTLLRSGRDTRHRSI
jgi:N-acyl-D-aspartate/D-glutamate deacylase